MSPAPQSSRGLSLLEVLVTVTVLSLLIAVLSQGWFQSMHAQARLAAISDSQVAHQRIAIAVRQLVTEALMVDAEPGGGLRGDARFIEVDSSTSLRVDIGAAPLAARLDIVERGDGLSLQLGPRGPETAQALSFAFAQADWAYQDARGVTHRSWPPETTDRAGAPSKDRDDHLPRLLILRYRLAGEPRTHEVIASPRASPWAVPEATPPFPGLRGN